MLISKLSITIILCLLNDYINFQQLSILCWGECIHRQTTGRYRDRWSASHTTKFASYSVAC